MNEFSKYDFLAQWTPQGYRENFDVYEPQCGASERDIVEACLIPFASKDKTCLDIGCGGGFWMERWLCPMFRHVTGLDYMPMLRLEGFDNYEYLEIPDRDYTCYQVSDSSIDFVWSFGVFCHLPLDAIAEYLRNIMRVLKPGGEAVLFFSNVERRPGGVTNSGTDDAPSPQPLNDAKPIGWVENNWSTTLAMMAVAGFEDVRDLMPAHVNTLAYGRKRA